MFLGVRLMIEMWPMECLFVFFYLIVVIILNEEGSTSMLISATMPYEIWLL